MALREFQSYNSPQEILWLQPLEWCTGIFRRRFDRPSNSLIPQLQVSENTLAPQSLFTSQGKSGSRNKFEDEPLPPPPEIQDKLPDFDVCAPSKCGSHVRSGEQPNALVDCYMCKATSAFKAMHALPCGHYLCRADLERLGANAFARIQDKANRESIWVTQCELLQMQEKLARLVFEHADGLTRQYQQRLIECYIVFLRTQVGLVCCGTKLCLLDTHMQCLDPRLARALCTVEMFLSADPRIRSRRCGWPDCQQYVPSQYTWFDQGLDDAYAQRWHCVICGGNSKLQSNNRLQPAR